MFIHGTTITQAAAAVGVNRETLYERCVRDNGITLSEYYQKRRERGNAHIHIAQFKKAIKELNPTMLIWLGKQRLGQKEATEEQVSQEIEKKFDEHIAKIMRVLNIASHANFEDAPEAELQVEEQSSLNIDDSKISSET